MKGSLLHPGHNFKEVYTREPDQRTFSLQYVREPKTILRTSVYCCSRIRIMQKGKGGCLLEELQNLQ